MFETFLDPVFVVDGRHKIVYANAPALAFVGMSLRRLQKRDRIEDVVDLGPLNLSLSQDQEAPFSQVTVKTAGITTQALMATRKLAGEQLWLISVRDLSMEDKLHQKYRLEVTKLVHQTEVLQRLAFVFLVSIFGFGFLATKYSVETIPPLISAAMRYFAGGLAIAGYLAMWEKKRFHNVSFGKVIFLSLLNRAIPIGALSWAVLKLPSGVAATVVSSAPLWLALIEHFARTYIFARRLWLGLALGTLGLLVLASDAYRGHLPALELSVLFWATILNAFGTKMALKEPDGQVSTLGLELIVGGVLLMIGALALGEFRNFSIREISDKSIMAQLYLTIFVIALGRPAQVWLMTHSSATRASSVLFLVPVVGIAAGALIAKESITVPAVISCLCLILSAYLINSRKVKKNS